MEGREGREGGREGGKKVEIGEGKRREIQIEEEEWEVGGLHE